MNTMKHKEYKPYKRQVREGRMSAVCCQKGHDCDRCSVLSCTCAGHLRGAKLADGARVLDMSDVNQWLLERRMG